MSTYSHQLTRMSILCRHFCPIQTLYISSAALLSVLLSAPLTVIILPLSQNLCLSFLSIIVLLLKHVSTRRHRLHCTGISANHCNHHTVISSAITCVSLYRGKAPSPTSTNCHIYNPEYMILPFPLSHISTSAISVSPSLCHRDYFCSTYLALRFSAAISTADLVCYPHYAWFQLNMSTFSTHALIGGYHKTGTQ